MRLDDDLRERLARAAEVEDRAERHLAVAAVLSDCLAAVGPAPIVVGGAAVEIYTHGGYTTDDLDLVAPGGPAAAGRMRALGFRRHGKDYVHEGLGLYVEFPSSALGPSERAIALEVGRSRVQLVAREDLIVDRLCAFKFWRSALDGLSAMLLMESGDVDDDRLASRATEEHVEDALTAVREVGEAVVRKRLSRRRANALLEARMRALEKR